MYPLPEIPGPGKVEVLDVPAQRATVDDINPALP